MQSALALIGKVRRLQAARAALEKLTRPEPSSTKVQRVEVTATFDVAKYKDDFVAFAALLDILPKDGREGFVKLHPSAIQLEVEANRTGRDIVLKPRQVGLTTWELARDVWKLVCHKGERIVIVVQSSEDDDQAKDIASKLQIMFDSLRAVGLRFPFSGDSKLVREWSLGSSSLTIKKAGASEAAAQKKGRGGTITRLHITELAFYEQAAVTLNAIMEAVPTIETAPASEVIIESTANGAAGEFFDRYHAAKMGKGGYKALFFRWMDHAEYATPLSDGETIEPRTARERQLVENYGGSPEQLKWFRAKVDEKGQDKVDQEYPIDEETCWLIAGRMFFDREACVALKAKTSEPIETAWRGELRIWAHPKEGQSYVLVADPSEGDGGDPGAAGVFDRVTGEHVATLHGQFPVGVFADKLDELGRMYNQALLVVERNNHGHAVLNALLNPPAAADGKKQRKPYPRVFRDRDGKPGWVATATSRPAALDTLEDAVRKKSFATRDARVVGEMFNFIVNKNGKAEASTGAHDDLVIMAAIARSVLTTTTATPFRGTGTDRLLPFG